MSKNVSDQLVEMLVQAGVKRVYAITGDSLNPVNDAIRRDGRLEWIHETNLKKQGMLALTFANEADYDKIQEDDVINFLDLTAFAPHTPLHLEFVHKDGTKDVICCNHTYNAQQIEWFRAGSALNKLAN